MPDKQAHDRPLIFISWSGPRARHVANTLADHIQDLLNVETFTSPNIQKGQEWNNAIHSAIRKCVAGIVILTPENATAPWLLYEAGAVKTARPETDRAKTLFVGWRPADYSGPLEAFQGTNTEREDFYQLIQSLNSACGYRTPTDTIQRSFDRQWPEIAAAFETANTLSVVDESVPERSETDMIPEILEIVRDLQRLQNISRARIPSQPEAHHHQTEEQRGTQTPPHPAGKDINDQSEISNLFATGLPVLVQKKTGGPTYFVRGLGPEGMALTHPNFGTIGVDWTAAISEWRLLS